MPELRLKKTGEAYELRCNHRSQMVSDIRRIQLPDGTSDYERVPQKFRVRASDSRYCLGCRQIVDAQDDAEAVESLN